MKRVLSLDGGGIRGIFTARILVEMETRAKKPISALFDMIAGVSTGGILACMLAAPDESGQPKYSAAEVVEFYRQSGPEIFDAGLGRKIFSIGGIAHNRYSDHGMEQALEAHLGDRRLSEVRTAILVSAFDIEANQPFFFKSSRAREGAPYEFYLRDVCRATAAAPTYFDPAIVYSATGRRQVLIDGGVFATNPAMHAYAEAGRLWPNEQALIVSIGTGLFPARNDCRKFMSAGDLQWVSPLLDMMFAGSAITVDYQLFWRGAEYVRFNRNLKLASSDMDDASPKNLDALVTEAEQFIAERSPDIDRLLARIGA